MEHVPQSFLREAITLLEELDSNGYTKDLLQPEKISQNSRKIERSFFIITKGFMPVTMLEIIVLISEHFKHATDEIYITSDIVGHDSSQLHPGLEHLLLLITCDLGLVHINVRIEEDLLLQPANRIINIATIETKLTKFR